eukprot:TRINITY_DN19042_c0_g1_i3.p1 TRINITY_DN19042_c0_g1~~TRINITY_DN19042_c0_g1_i3.p1  ORF type:complete len:182 (+),score=60.12 TRINITY_DN19042_c0_g1_i3:156-701(+)
MCGSACWFSIFVLFLGQKRFSCPDASKAPDAIQPGDEYNEANDGGIANGKVLSPMGTTMNSTTFGNSTNLAQPSPYGGSSAVYGGGGYYGDNSATAAEASSPVVNNDYPANGGYNDGGYPSNTGGGGYPAAVTTDDISKPNDEGYPAPEAMEEPRNTSSPAMDHYESPPLGVEAEMNDMEA